MAEESKSCSVEGGNKSEPAGAAPEADLSPPSSSHRPDSPPQQNEQSLDALSSTPYAEPQRPRPEPVGPVAYRGKMVEREDGQMVSLGGKPLTRIVRGYEPENAGWYDWLCDRDRNGRLAGKDPMSIPLDVLSASGHPYARAAAVVLRLRVMHGVDNGDARHDGFLGLQPDDFPKSLTAIRETVCLPCSSDNMAEVRRCAIMDCPAFPYRMGRNPHNPRRGHNPFAPKPPSEDAEQDR